MAGEMPRFVSLFKREREVVKEYRGGGVDTVVERLIVRCRDANVVPDSEALKGPEAERTVDVEDNRLDDRPTTSLGLTAAFLMGPETERTVEMLDDRLVDRALPSLVFETARRALRGGIGGASIFPFEVPDTDATERCEYDPTFLAARG